MELHNKLSLSHKAIIAFSVIDILLCLAGFTMLIIGAMDCSGYWTNVLQQESFSLDGAIAMVVLGVCFPLICLCSFLNLLFHDFNHKEK